MKLIDFLKIKYGRIPAFARTTIQTIPLLWAIFYLIPQLISDAVPNSKTIFSIVFNCQTIVLYMLVFFLSPVLKKIKDDINYVKAQPQREASKKANAWRISR
jgi:hypothetical protein